MSLHRWTKSHRPIPQSGPDADRLDSHNQRPEGLVFKPRPAWRRIGLYHGTVLVIGTILMFGATAFLVFLWFGDQHRSVWRRIVQRQWITRTVTLIALLIRTVVSLQAGIAVSMLATSILERNVTMPHLAEISIMRYATKTPLSAFLVILQSASADVMIAVIITLLTISTTALQFASTVLLSDFGQKAALTVNITQSVETLFDNNAALMVEGGASPRYWTLPPTQFATFAEYTDSKYFQSTEEVYDTGVALRGFLPITSDNRTTLQDYVGFATILDMRVACVQPIIGNISYTSFENAEYGTSNLTYLSGTLTPKMTVPLLDTSVQYPVDFTCMINNYQTSGLATPSYSICVLDTASGFTTPLSNNSGSPSDYGFAYLILNHTGVAGYNYDLLHNARYVTRARGLWTQILESKQASTGNGTLATMCFENRRYYTNSSTQVVSVHGHGNRTEPQVTLSNATLGTFNTESVRKQLGATNDTLGYDERGILSLDAHIDDDNGVVFPATGHHGNISLPNTSGVEASVSTFTTILLLALNSIMFCTDCLGDGGVSIVYVNLRQKAVFLDVLSDTKNPALALQAFFTGMTQLAYYDVLNFFNVPTNATITIPQSANVPVESRGLAGVLVVMWIHVTLVWLCTLIFTTRSRYTLLNNAWQVFSQAPEIINDETIAQSSNVSDSEIKKSLAASGRLKERWILRRVNGRGQESSDPKVILTRRLESASVDEPYESSVSLQPLVKSPELGVEESGNRDHDASSVTSRRPSKTTSTTSKQR